MHSRFLFSVFLFASLLGNPNFTEFSVLEVPSEKRSEGRLLTNLTPLNASGAGNGLDRSSWTHFQQSSIDFEDPSNYSFVALGGEVLGEGVEADIVTNNDKLGINNSDFHVSITKSSNSSDLAGIGIVADGLTFTNGPVLVVKIRSEAQYALEIRLENTAMGLDSNGLALENLTAVKQVSNSKDWNELVIDFSQVAGFDFSNQFDRISFMPGTGSSGMEFQLDIDDVSFAGVSPSISPPIPTRNQEDVVSIYSDSYTSAAVSDFAAFGGASFEEVVIDGNSFIKYSMNPEQPEGREVTIQLDVEQDLDSARMSHLHFDLWYAGPVDNAIQLTFEIWNNPANWEISGVNISKTSSPGLVQGQWISFDLELDELSSEVFDAVRDFEFLFDAARNYGEVYLDNIYFYEKFPNSTASIPIDFEGEDSVSGILNGNDQGFVVQNPDANGINTSNRVFQFTRTQGSVNSGFFNLFSQPLNLQTENVLSFKVWSSGQGVRMALQLESDTDPQLPPLLLKSDVYKAEEWLLLSFDFGELNVPLQQYDRITIFPDSENDLSQEMDMVYYFDDFDQYNSQVWFPIDPAFEQVLIERDIDESGPEGLVRKTDVLEVTTLNLSGKDDMDDTQDNPVGRGIVSLSGIEYFTALRKFRFDGNSVKAVDLTQNLNLEEIRAWHNGLENLNITGLKKLFFLGLNFNNVERIDLNSNEGLRIIGLADNGLREVLLPRTSNLSILELNNNQLVGLDISGVDSNLSTVFTVLNNPLLECIEVSNLSNADLAERWFKDDTAFYSENCSGAQDLGLNRALIELRVRTRQNTEATLVNGESEIFPISENESLVIEMEILFPEDVEFSEDSFLINFSAFGLEALYSIENNPLDENDFYFDYNSSNVSADILQNSKETTKGISSSFQLTSNGNSQVPDAVLIFQINNDGIAEKSMPGEEITFTFFEDLGANYAWQQSDLGGNLIFSAVIEDAQNLKYNLDLDNLGSTESSEDVFTMTLYKDDVSGDGILPVEYALSASDGPVTFEVQLTPGQSTDIATEAEPGDFGLQNSSGLVTIPVGESSAQFRVDLFPDTDAENEVYEVAIGLFSALSFGREDVKIVNPNPITLYDSQGTFDVIVKPSAKNQVSNNLYQLEEGASLELDLIPVSGARVGEQFRLNVNLVETGQAAANLNTDYLVPNLNNGQITFTSSEENPAVLLVDARVDALYSEGTERFELELSADKIIGGNQDFRLLDANSEVVTDLIRIPVEIIDVVAAKIETTGTRSRVEEDADEFGEFVVSLAEPNTSGKDIIIDFEVSTDSEALVGFGDRRDFILRIDGKDIDRTQSSIVIPPGEQENKIEVRVNVDGTFEQDERVILQLNEGARYLLPNTSEFPRVAQVSILNDDQAIFRATIQPRDENIFVFENRNGAPLPGFFRVSLDKPNDTESDIRVDFEVKRSELNAASLGIDCDTEGLVVDYVLNTGTTGNFVLIPPGELFADIEVTPCDDLEEEDVEIVQLDLLAIGEGVDVFVDGVPSSATLLIASNESNPTEIKPTDLLVTASSASCIEDVSGSIRVRNVSSINYQMTVRSATVERNIPLPQFTDLEVDNLDFGTYLISFENLTNELVPPRFEVNVEAFVPLALKSVIVDDKKDAGLIGISGSSSYHVQVGDLIYYYDVGHQDIQFLEIPLQPGENRVFIKGEQECQGVIEHLIVYNKLVPLPNPAKDVVRVLGISENSEVGVMLYAADGSVVYREAHTASNGEIQLDVSKLKAGTYFGSIVSSSRKTGEFKLLIE